MEQEPLFCPYGALLCDTSLLPKLELNHTSVLHAGRSAQCGDGGANGGRDKLQRKLNRLLR